jgi:hypothetical protein
VFVILTSKPGQFRTEIGEALEPVESYDYVYCGRTCARFVIARLERETKVRIVEETANPAVNEVPSKFLPAFGTVAEARRELQSLVRSGAQDVTLIRCSSP